MWIHVTNRVGTDHATLLQDNCILNRRKLKEFGMPACYNREYTQHLSHMYICICVHVYRSEFGMPACYNREYKQHLSHMYICVYVYRSEFGMPACYNREYTQHLSHMYVCVCICTHTGQNSGRLRATIVSIHNTYCDLQNN
jgi:hypothetical protein